MNKTVKILLIATGTLFVGIAVIGIFVPVLPTTPFLLVAAALYARSSARFYNWLVNNRLFGRYIKNYREGMGIPLKIKIAAITLSWIMIGCSAIFAIDKLWIRIILVVIAAGVTAHISLIRPKK
ncbi:MAG: DUF454 domain-containing protein [Actinobacteria bacterium]|nr:DUF454 domain-containing protein [Actinomycetota bacterium]